MLAAVPALPDHLAVEFEFLLADMASLGRLADLYRSESIAGLAQESAARVARIRRELVAAPAPADRGLFATLTPAGLSALRAAIPGPGTSAVLCALDRLSDA